MSGYKGGFALSVFGDSSFRISGGSFVGGDETPGGANGFAGAAAYFDLGVTGEILGGSFSEGAVGVSGLGSLWMLEDAAIDVLGGTFHGAWNLFGHSSITAHGDLIFDGARLTGTLDDGHPIDVAVNVYDVAQLIVVPESSTALLLGCGLLILGSLRAASR